VEVTETVVTVVDLEPPADADARSSSHGASTEPGLLEGSLLVAVGLATLAVEGVARAVVAAIGERSSPVAEASDVEDGEPEAEGADEPETLAVIAGAGLNLVLGAARSLTRIAADLDRVVRPFSLVTMVPPVDRVARRLEGSALRLNDTWRDERLEGQRAAEAFADALAPHLVDAVIDRLDLTELVLDRVDLDRVAGSVSIDRLIERVDPMTVVDRLDVDAVAARVDVERIVDRLDLVAIARSVIEELDLPSIIRESTETMAAETRDSVRVHGIRADRFVSRLVDRALLRQDGTPGQPSGDAPGPTEDPP
jgi:hypothetical protein